MSGDERVLRCTVGRFIQSELKGSHLLLARRPPSFMLDVLHYGRHWGLSRWRLVQSLPLRDRAASNRGPGHSTVLTGSSLHGGPQWTTTDQHCTYRNLCCTWYDAYVPLRHLTDCQDGAANGAGPSECTAGVTPAPSENLGQDD